ncbi:hypothetical protein GCM10029964_098870 [Kibdelosporangium lantanae]
MVLQDGRELQQQGCPFRRGQRRPPGLCRPGGGDGPVHVGLAAERVRADLLTGGLVVHRSGPAGRRRAEGPVDVQLGILGQRRHAHSVPDFSRDLR